MFSRKMLRAQFVTALLAAGALPPWLVAAPGCRAYVAEAPWPTGGRPEAAATFSARTAGPNPDDQTRRPADAAGAPIGVLATILGPASAGVARLRLPGIERIAFARYDRLLPVVPAGTALVVAGGFSGEARFFAHLDPRGEHVALLPTGTPLVALGMGIAPYDPDASDFVRVQVRIAGGPWHGRTGWVAAAYAGLSRPHGDPASSAERACRCRILGFRSPHAP